MILARVATFFILLLLGATPARADVNRDGGPGPRRVTEGTLLWRTASQSTPTPAPLLATDVDLRVTGLVVRATVRQQFSNPSGEWAEGVYVFPLPEDAAVDHLKMRVGDRVVEGVIRERVAAKKAYEQARQQGQRASLVEQERPNVFTTCVANIPPGAAVAVEIEYQQAVRYDAGRFRLRFPMVVGPRYIPDTVALGASGAGWAPDTDAVPDASRITPPVRHPSEGPINPVTLRIELDPGVPLAGVESPSHAIHTTSLRGGRYEIALQQGSVPADRDFELAWAPVAGAVPAAVLLTEAKGDEVFALLMVMPPAPAAAARERLPREAIFVLDHSGSMAGASIQEAKAALKLALARLRPTDTFNVIRFNHRTDGLFQEARPATSQNLGAAERYVDALRANGGTEILPALVRALDGGEPPDRVRQVIFLTDGAVGNEHRLFEAIRERLGDSRLFTIGIGSAPNSHFMREAARLGRGTFTHVGSPGEVQQRMTELLRKLESPVLADLRLELPGAGDPEVLPHPLPDLYAGEPVVVALRGRTLPTHAVLRGRSGTTAWEADVPLRESAPGAGLAVYWAQARIAALLDQRRASAPDGDVRHAVIEVALRHHLVSAYTSLVAVDVTPARPADAPLISHALATNLPHGWEYDAVFGAGQGATAAPLHLVIGLASLSVAAALRLWLGRGNAPGLVRHQRGA
ncbi:MAG TPA: marine proteobacterial sortase target protein [Methylomirabilota bacterium]|nr:marine proteobacterial sortase target protein [Methylomirabilota bacterium]